MGTFKREALRMQSVRPRLYPKVIPHLTSDDTPGGEALSVQDMGARLTSTDKGE